MNPFQYIFDHISAALDGLTRSVVAFFTMVSDFFANLFNPAPYILWLSSFFPVGDTVVSNVFAGARAFLSDASVSIRMFNLALDLPALAMCLTFIIALEVVLAVIWAWRGLLSLIPMAG